MRPRTRLLLVLPSLALAATTLAACGGDDDTPTASEDGVDTVSCDYPSDGRPPAKEVDPPTSEAPQEGEVSLTLTTSAGDIPIVLDSDAAPCTVHSFRTLADQGYFDDTQCHRITTQGIYVLQCGDPTATGTGGPGYSYADELGGDETYGAGTLAMANAGPDTNGSQFFIVYEDTELPPSYTVFGSVEDAGLEVVRAVAQRGAAGGAPDGPPQEPVTITSVE